jgi:hypothetical protein
MIHHCADRSELSSIEAMERIPYRHYGSARVLTDELRITGYLFSKEHRADQSAPYLFKIPQYRLARGRQTFVLRRPLVIDLRRIEPDLYRVHLVHDFWSDDDNPDLSECMGAIFFGRLRGPNEWEVPERWPIECRSVKILGTVDTRDARYVVSLFHE